jgi:uncharacterized protein with HEPN domain
MELRQVAYLLDILRSAEAVQSYIEGYSREDFLKDPKTQDAVLRRLLVIGEAAARITRETEERFEEIPFRKMAGLRNRVVHDYGQIDLEIILENGHSAYASSKQGTHRLFLDRGRSPAHGVR